MNRITITDLRAQAARLNDMTFSPGEEYKRDEQGTLRANVGNYHISKAYGGYCLHRMVNESGGVRDVLNSGHVPARDLYGRISAYIYGLRDGALEVKA